MSARFGSLKERWQEYLDNENNEPFVNNICPCCGSGGVGGKMKLGNAVYITKFDVFGIILDYVNVENRILMARVRYRSGGVAYIEDFYPFEIMWIDDALNPK